MGLGPEPPATRQAAHDEGEAEACIAGISGLAQTGAVSVHSTDDAHAGQETAWALELLRRTLQ